MSEKRGETEKLVNEFNTAGVLEVFMTKLNGWYRVTSKDFRSFNGLRRLTEPSTTEKGNPWVDMKTYEYYGPVYQWGTNTIIEYTNSGSLETSKWWEQAKKVSEERGE